MCYLIEKDELLQVFQEVEEKQLWRDEGRVFWKRVCKTLKECSRSWRRKRVVYPGIDFNWCIHSRGDRIVNQQERNEVEQFFGGNCGVFSETS